MEFQAFLFIVNGLPSTLGDREIFLRVLDFSLGESVKHGHICQRQHQRCKEILGTQLKEIP